MNPIKRRLNRLEASLAPKRHTESGRRSLERLETRLRRVAEYRKRYGLPPRAELPNTLDYRTVAAILHWGRAQNALPGQAFKSERTQFGKRPIAALSPNLRLAYEMALCYAEPLDFVLLAYPWGEKGTPLENEEGPDASQVKFLLDLGDQVKARQFSGGDPVMPILMNISSGHGTGKSVLGAWIADWILSTRPYSIGTVTANTYQQLESRTWAAIRRWTKLSITAPWFTIQKASIYSKHCPEDWKVVMQTCREENAQSFAGQHAKDSTSWYLFDEASNIPDPIWDVAFGGLTDGEPMFFAWGQLTRNNGRFHDTTFGTQRNRWNHRTFDSRESRFTNKELMKQWEADYGEDSDYFRVRVLGLPPRASDLQYIDSDRIYGAQHREAVHLHDDPLVVGVDVARGGKSETVFWFRRGMDARSIPPIRISGEESRDSMVIVNKLLQVMNTYYQGVKPDAAFVDSGFGGSIVDRCRQLGHTNIFEVRFGAACPDPLHYANMRAFMWSRVREFLQRGAIPTDPRLAIDLAGPSVKMDKQDRICLESKEEMEKRGLASPDSGDALALTFAQTVLPAATQPEDEDEDEGYGRWGNYPNYGRSGWMR